MSVSTNQSTDTSTDNANWGTLVVLLVLAFVAVTIGVILYNDSQKPAVPISVTAPASAATTTPAAAPAPAAMQGAPGAGTPAVPTGAGNAGVPAASGTAGGIPTGGGQ